MQRKSTISRVVFSRGGACLILAALAGCGGTTTPTSRAPPRPFDGTTVKVACPSAVARSVVERYGRNWATRQGVRLEVLPYQSQAGPDTTAGADVWLIEPAALAYWASADRLQPLPDEYTRERSGTGDEGRPAYDWAGLLPLYRERLLRWGSRAYALPVLGEAPLCFYRLDLFADPAIKDAFRGSKGRDLASPATWDDFADIAEFFHARPETRPSLPPLADDDEIDREFHAIAASRTVRAIDLLHRSRNQDLRAEMFSFECDFPSGEPRIASPGFVDALQLLQRLHVCRAPGDGKPGPEAFAAGRAVLCLADASWIVRFRKGPVGAKFGICRVPGSQVVFPSANEKKDTPAGGNYVPYLGAAGYLGVVPRGAAQADAAFALLAELSGPETSRQIAIEPEWGGGAFRRDQLADAAGWSSFGLDQGQSTALVQALQQALIHPGLDNPATRLRLPNQSEYRGALLDEIRAALAGKKDAAAALKAADQRWRSLDTSDQRRAAYAASLGLAPR